MMGRYRQRVREEQKHKIFLVVNTCENSAGPGTLDKNTDGK